MMRKRFTANLLQMIIDCYFIILIGFTLFDCNGIHWTVSEACTEPIAEVIGKQFGLAVNNLNCTFGTRRDTIATTIAFILINFDHFTNHLFISCLSMVSCKSRYCRVYFTGM